MISRSSSELYESLGSCRDSHRRYKNFTQVLRRSRIDFVGSSDGLIFKQPVCGHVWIFDRQEPAISGIGEISKVNFCFRVILFLNFLLYFVYLARMYASIEGA